MKNKKQLWTILYYLALIAIVIAVRIHQDKKQEAALETSYQIGRYVGMIEYRMAILTEVENADKECRQFIEFKNIEKLSGFDTLEVNMYNYGE